MLRWKRSNRCASKCLCRCPFLLRRLSRLLVTRLTVAMLRMIPHTIPPINPERQCETCRSVMPTAQYGRVHSLRIRIFDPRSSLLQPTSAILLIKPRYSSRINKPSPIQHVSIFVGWIRPHRLLLLFLHQRRWLHPYRLPVVEACQSTSLPTQSRHPTIILPFHDSSQDRWLHADRIYRLIPNSNVPSMRRPIGRALLNH